MRHVFNSLDKLNVHNTAKGDKDPYFLKREDLWDAVRAVHVGSVVKEHELLSVLISFTVTQAL
jgi:hypothetical protein